MKHTKPMTQKEKKIVEANSLFVNLCKAIPTAEEMNGLSRKDRKIIDMWAYFVNGICEHTLSNDYKITRYSPVQYPLPRPLWFRYLLDTLRDKGYDVSEEARDTPGYITYDITWGNVDIESKIVNSITRLIRMLVGLPAEYMDFRVGDDYQVFVSGPGSSKEYCFDVPKQVYETIVYSCAVYPNRYYDIESVIKRLETHKEEDNEY
nr:MAG TPA: hypothetical protein [Caudoviricetes sp.]